MKIIEDWIMQLEFPRRAVLTNPKPYNEYSIRNNFEIYCYMDEFGNCLFWGECIQGEDFFIIKCDDEKVFKNIVKVLTGNELVIK